MSTLDVEAEFHRSRDAGALMHWEIVDPAGMRAACMSARPMWGLRAALVRIARTSASMERPCSFA